MLHILKIDNGILLDGFHLKGVSAYKVKQNKDKDFACLTLEMDVSILDNTGDSKFNSTLDQHGNRTDGDR